MGRGHVRQRGEKTWELKWDAPTDNGGRKTFYKNVKGTKREAQAQLTKLVAAAANGNQVEPSKLTVEQYIRKRLGHWKLGGMISAGTAQRYGQLIEGQIVPHLGSKLLQRLTTEDIEIWHSILLTIGRRGRNGKPDGESGLSARLVTPTRFWARR